MNNNLKVVSFMRSPAYVHHRAMMNRRDNNIVDALELMRRAVEQSPQNREYRLDLAELYCEMGCHEQSSRLLLDMLAEGDGPSECYYGLALNQLGMNDVAGARRSLRLYRRRDPEGAHLEEVRQLAEELDFYSELGHRGSRKLIRAVRVANRACDAMKADQPRKACRLFERSLAMASEQYEMRALYAMALLMCGESERARRQAEQAAGGYPPSVKALCVSAQVYALMGDITTARALVDRAAAEKPEGQDLRLMIYAMGELRMDDRVAEYARLALQETPFDRDLLHMRAVALMRCGAPERRVARFWARILRIDPEDSVAQFYQTTAARNELHRFAPEYGYQVPPKEFERRLRALVSHLGEGYEHVAEQWRTDPGFRQLVRWAVCAEEPRLSRAAMTALTTIDSTESRSLLRSLLFGGDLPEDLRLHATLALRLQGIPRDELMPEDVGLEDGCLPAPEAVLSRLGVGERQVVRYADEVLQREYGESALSHLALLWTAYRQLRGTHSDPLLRVESASAALAYTYMLMKSRGERLDPQTLAGAFGCTPRQMLFCARRIAGSLARMGEDTSDEDL